MADRRPLRATAGRGVVLGVLLTLCLVGPAGAQATAGPDVSAAQLQALAARAVDDPRALAQLRAVQRVDGRPVDLAQALDGADGTALQDRLRTLAGPAAAGSPGVAASDARRDAQAVLRGRRFRPSKVPRPFAGILHAIGRWLQPVFRPIGAVWERIARGLTGRIVAVVLVFVVAAAVSLRFVGRRSPASLSRSRRLGVESEGLDPDGLEREAREAELAGDLRRAVRLRFLAGVLRLDETGVITYSSSMTTGQIGARLRSGPFTALATTFEEIAYGGRPADDADVRAAATEWPRIVEAARR